MYLFEHWNSLPTGSVCSHLYKQPQIIFQYIKYLLLILRGRSLDVYFKGLLFFWSIKRRLKWPQTCQLTKDKIQRKKQTTSDDDVWLETSGVLIPGSATYSLCGHREVKRFLPLLSLLWSRNIAHLLDDLWNSLFLFLQSTLEFFDWQI